jgi:tRNA(Glu) U13 pseudouridine synthase TruD/ribosomal protein S27AE
MTTPKETCPKCGAEVSVIAVESALIDFNCGTTKWSDAIAERHQLPKLNQSDRCRITELEKENERLRKNQLKTNGFEIEVSWYWGRSCSFKETAKFWSQTNDREEIKKHVLHLVNKIKDRYCFDCGDLSLPLHPSIGSVRITPSVKIESEYIYDEEILQNNLIKEHTSTLLDKGGKTE